MRHPAARFNAAPRADHGAAARPVALLFLAVGLLVAGLLSGSQPAGAQQGEVRINEILASNDSSIPDEFGEFEDWVELRNRGAALDVSGWTLTDDAAAPGKWAFPQGTTIDAGGYLVIYASNKAPLPGSGNLHASFKLRSGGEYLGLYDSQGTLVDDVGDSYPPQQTDVSWGLDVLGRYTFFANPSPGEANGGFGVVGDVEFSVAHGFFEDDFNLTLSSPTVGATIRFTTDGSEPTLGSGATYSSPISVDESTVIRARAYQGAQRPSTLATQTYLFLDDVIDQDSTPPGFPTDPVNGQEFAWGMDGEIVDGNEDQVKASLESIPTMSLVTDLDNLFDRDDGIFVNATQDGREWERPGSLELIDPTGADAGFEVNAGIRIRGGFSRRDENPKHAFRFFFRSEYGDSRLQYPLFGDDGADSFEKIDLRTSQNYSWADARDSQNTLVRELWSRDTQGEMGQPNTRSEYYHLYVNAQYFGIFQTQERVSKEYAESYFGGDKEDYDVIKSDTGVRYATVATDGTTDAWQGLWPFVSDEFVSASEYSTIAAQVDLENLADYYLLHFFSGDFDGAPSWFLNGSTPEDGPRYSRANNWQAIRERDGGKWVFFDHDSEHSLCIRDGGPDEGAQIDNTGPWPTGDDSLDWEVTYFNPGWLHHALLSNGNYVQLFRDRVQEHFIDAGGVLSTQRNRARLDARVAELQPAVLAHSARWGDGKGGSPQTVADWSDEIDFIRGSCLSERRGVVLDQLGADGLVPTLDPPSASRSGGVLPFGQTVTLANPNNRGAVVFTLDGTDPRGLNGQPSASAQVGTFFAVRDYLDVVARVRSGSDWSAPFSVSFEPASIPTPPAILLNEYNAVDADEFLANANTDETFGRIAGNGGDWFELVVLEDDLDLRGWEFELYDGETTTRSRDRFVLTNNLALSAIPAGTIITVSEQRPDDVSVDPAAGDWSMNLQANNADDGLYVTAGTQENFSTNPDDWQLVIRDSSGNVRSLRTGEGTGALTGVGPREVGKLEETPSPAIRPTSNYDDGSTSTFGLPNRWDDQLQDLTGLRGFAVPAATVSLRCVSEDGRVDVELTNSGTISATFEITLSGLAPRTRTVGAGESQRETFTARPDGLYTLTVNADGQDVTSRNFAIACDPEVTISTSCVQSNGRVSVRLANRTGAAATYEVRVGRVTKTRTVGSNANGRVNVTGRADGPLLVETLRNGQQVDSTTVIINCDPPGPEVTTTSKCLSGNGVVQVVLDNPDPVAHTYVVTIGTVAPRTRIVEPASMVRLSVSGRPDGPIRTQVTRDGVEIYNETMAIECDLLPGSEVTVSTGCLRGLGRADVTLFNNSGATANYTVTIEPLASRSRTLSVGDVRTITATGRPEGPILISVDRNGTRIFNTTRVIACAA